MKNLKEKIAKKLLRPLRKNFAKVQMRVKRKCLHANIFDLGLHVGQDTAFYLKQGYRVVAVDANPAMIENASKKFSKEIEQGRLHLVSGAISETEGEIVTFFVNNQLPEWSSLDSEIGARVHGATEVSVSTVRLDKLIRKFGKPYYLKIDIEGADLLAVSQIPRHARPRYVSVENGERELLEALLELGYTKFKYVNQADLKGTELTGRSREGCAEYHWFPFGSSGPFGRDLPGRWLDKEEARAFTDALQNRRREMGSSFEQEVGWFDLHASRGGYFMWLIGI